MTVKTREFGKTNDGKSITLYSLQNSNGVVAEVIDFGANIVNIYVPDKNGKVEDVVLGYDNAQGYFENGCFFGATIGPSANRIADAKFEIEGVTYQLPVNDGANNLHSDANLGYHKRMWDAVVNNDGVTFSLEDQDGCMGFPGNKKVKVAFVLTEENELKITYDVASDKNTLINMTNHVYFNLEGHDKGNILNHKLYLAASKYTPVVAGAIPTGELASVRETPFDFLTATVIGDRIEDNNEQLHLVQGYDHNWVVDDFDGSMKKIAELSEPVSGRKIEVHTDQPGVQFYAGNCITPHVGKAGVKYDKRSGLCLETQAFPNSINQAGFPNVIYGPGKDYHTTTIYKFSW